MEIINTNAGGIDVGSRSHYVAVGQSLKDVKEFGVYTEYLTKLCEWLLSYGITSVAMESTGDYWQNLYTELLKHGIDVVLCNGKFTKHPKGKKTDVKDCRHIQKLHALGILTSSFLPDETTEILRTYCRQGRQAVVSATARKLGVIIWTMITKKVQYSPPAQYLFLDQKRKMKLVSRIKKNIAKFDLKPEDIGFGNSQIISANI